MARLLVCRDELVVRLTWWERIAARRGSIHLSRAAVKNVAVQPDWWRALRGTRVRGPVVPGILCLGVWRHSGGQDFVALRLRHRLAVYADLRAPSPFARITVSVPQARETVAAIRAALDRTATETTNGQPSPSRPA